MNQSVITYNQLKDAIIINEKFYNRPSTSRIIKLSLAIAIFSLYLKNNTRYFWFILGSLYIVLFILNLIKFDVSKEIAIDKIHHVEVRKHSYKQDICRVFLKNKKRREILIPKNDTEALEIFKRLQIKIV